MSKARELAELGAEVTVDADGSVGIGTDSPENLLHLMLPSGVNGEILMLSRSAGAYHWSIGNNLNSRFVIYNNAGDESFLLGNDGSIETDMFHASSGEYDGDMDNLKRTGFYRSRSTNANNPAGTYFAVVVYGNQGNVTTQIATQLNSTITYVRSFNNSWTSWQRLDT